MVTSSGHIGPANAGPPGGVLCGIDQRRCGSRPPMSAADRCGGEGDFAAIGVLDSRASGQGRKEGFVLRANGTRRGWRAGLLVAGVLAQLGLIAPAQIWGQSGPSSGPPPVVSTAADP